ncbi:hypothetical protein VZG28_06315 [Synechococcus elongatus IITB4]|uniref:hypothetical protein n=1 Tax=Synechococcus elongatus TaxID=32046 RepID=UPI0030D3AE9D
MKPRLSLKSFHGEVHRFTGTVDRFGRFATAEGWQETVCIRDIHLADTNRPVQPDHWWFRLRDIWLSAGVQVGDRVLFTVKVRACSKGFDGPDVVNSDKPRRQVIGFGSKPRSVAILQKAAATQKVSETLQQLTQQQIQLETVVQDCQQLQQVQQQLVEQNETLASQLSQTRVELEQEQQRTEQQAQVCSQLRFALRRAQHWSRPVLTASTALVVGLGSGFGLAQVNPVGLQAEQAQIDSEARICRLDAPKLSSRSLSPQRL